VLSPVRPRSAKLPNLPLVGIKAAPAAPLARRQRPGSSLSRGPPGRTPGHKPTEPQIQAVLTSRASAHDSAIFLGGPLSSSRPPRQGRSLRLRRTRSAPPTLDPMSTHKGSAPIEEEGRKARLLRPAKRRRYPVCTDLQVGGSCPARAIRWCVAGSHAPGRRLPGKRRRWPGRCAWCPRRLPCVRAATPSARTPAPRP
jgi:hypothetical protein